MTQKTILLATLGIKPQIITETLYAIHQEGLDWPDEIIIITNKKCKDIAINALLNCPTDQKSGKIQELCNHIKRPAPLFNLESFFTITDQGSFDDFIAIENKIEDDIVDFVRKLAEDEKIIIHAAYTGGIKTMATILCRAMDFFGRPKDILSSVFVHPDYQSQDDFYYPKDQELVLNKGRDNERKANANEAKITIRITKPLPYKSQTSSKNKLSELHVFSYSKLIEYFEYSQYPENIKVEFHYNEENSYIAVLYKTDIIKIISFAKYNTIFAFYAMCANAYCNDIPIYKPKAINKLSVKEIKIENKKSMHLLDLLCEQLEKMHFLKRDESYPLFALQMLKDKSREPLETDGISASGFSTHNGNLESYIISQVSSHIASLITPKQLDGKKENPYNLKIPAANISFHH